MPEDAIRDSADKNYEEYIAELETELSEAKQRNIEFRQQVGILTAERNGARTRATAAEDAHAACYQDLAMEQYRTSQQDAITAWAMGFE